MTVTGIEISQAAIDLAQKRFGRDLTIYHGSVTEIYLLDKTKGRNLSKTVLIN